jgi:hypothetical protein
MTTKAEFDAANETGTLTDGAILMVKKWIATDGPEGAAQYMARTLRLFGIRTAREIVALVQKC